MRIESVSWELEEWRKRILLRGILTKGLRAGGHPPLVLIRPNRTQSAWSRCLEIGFPHMPFLLRQSVIAAAIFGRS